MRTDSLKVGDLARRTGLTVRTLHHYDQIGLLKPTLHSESGYRLYSAGDVARLQRILSLRQLGFALEQVRECLDRDGFSPLEVIELHLARLREQIDAQRKLSERLQSLALHLRAVGSPEEISADELLQAIEEMTMLDQIAEKYFTPEQRNSIKAAREEIGQETLERRQEEWAELIALIRAEMDRGTDPAAPNMQVLTRRWQELLHWSTGGDPEVEASMKRLWEEQGDTLAAQFGSKYDSRPIWGYVARAIEVGKGSA